MPKQAEAKRDSVINPQNDNFTNFNTENYDALKRYESTEVDRRTWLHVPSGTLWSTSSDTHQVVEIETRTSHAAAIFLVYKWALYMIKRIRCLISFAWTQQSCLEWEGSKNSNWKYPADIEPVIQGHRPLDNAEYQVKFYSLTKSWCMNTYGLVTIYVWNRLWFDSQYKVL